MKIDDGGPAFPVIDYGNGNYAPSVSHGLSLRDYFAAQALAGQINYEGMEGCDPKMQAAMAYELADAMLAQRRKEPA